MLRALSFHLNFHLFHNSGLFHQGSKILDGQWGNHQTNVSPKVVLKFPASPFLIKWHSVKAAEVLELLSIFNYKLPLWVNWRNFTSLAYFTLFGKYSERNFPLKASQVTGSSLSSMMDFMLIHQFSASPVSMYIAKANLFSAGHIFTSKILSISFSH